MKALVLSGGSGSRLRPFTHSMPKQLVPVANRPVLHYCMENLREIGVTEVGIIVGRHSAEIRTACGDGSNYGLKITYIEQSAPLGLAHCVITAEEFLGDDDFVMFLGDNIFAEGIADAAASFARNRPQAQVVVIKVDDPSQYGVVELDLEGAVEHLVEKPAEPRSDLAVTGAYFFTSAIQEAVRSIQPSRRGELEITDAIQWLLDHGRTVRAEHYSGLWSDTGNIDELLECNRQMMDRVLPDVRGEVDDASLLSGSISIEPGARVIRSRLTGPVIIAAGSLVSDAVVGPYSVVGRDCVLVDAGVSDTIILDGGSVRGVRGINGSLIGRGAVVVSNGNGNLDHRMLVGDHSRVEVPA